MGPMNVQQTTDYRKLRDGPQHKSQDKITTYSQLSLNYFIVHNLQ